MNKPGVVVGIKEGWFWVWRHYCIQSTHRILEILQEQLNRVRLIFFPIFNKERRRTVIGDSRVVHVQERPVLSGAMNLCVFLHCTVTVIM